MRVPVYESRARSAGLPTPTVRPAPTGTAELGAGMQRLGSAALKIALDAQERADRVRVDGADLELGKVLSGASWGEGGFLHQQGENALDYSAQLEGVNRSVAQISKGLASDRQREMFRSRALARIEQTRERWEKHSFGQWGVIQGQVAEGQTQFAMDEARENYQDHDAVHSAMMKVLHDPDGGPGVLVRYLRDVKGLPQEAIDRVVTKFQRDTLAGTLQRYLDTEDAAGAQAFLERFGEAMGPEADKARAGIAAIARKREALVEADRILAGARGGENDWVDEAKALGSLEAISDPVKREAVRGHLLHGLRVAEDGKRALITQRYEVARARFTRGGLRAIPQADMDWFNRNAPDIEAKFRSEAEAKWRQAKGDKQAKQAQDRANKVALLTFQGLPAEQRASLNLDEWAFGRGVDEMGLATLQREQRKQIDANAKGDNVGENSFVAAGMADMQGILTKDDDRDAYAAELRRSYAAIREANGGKPPTTEQAQAARDRLANGVLKEGWIRDSTIPAGQADAAARREAFRSGEGIPAPTVPGEASTSPAAPAPSPAASANADIPQHDRDMIVATLQARGVPVTEEEIRRLYDFHRGNR